MFFSKEIRDEITDIKIYDDNEIIALLSGVFMFCGSVVIKGNGKLSFQINTESITVAKKVSLLFKKMFSITLELYQKNNYNFNKEKIYTLEYTHTLNEISNILKKIFVLNEDSSGIISIRSDIDEIITKNENVVKSFLRGAYMMSGSIADPEKSYHLEFISHDFTFSQNFSALLNESNIKSNITQRKESFIIYIKESESISDLLNLIGAHKSMFKFEDIRIKKQVRNNINRIVNCETANLSKIAKTYVRQKKAIQYILNKKGLSFLPNELRQIAILRLENEDDSLKELGEKLPNPVSKSVVNRRLSKIEKIAQQIYEEE